MRLRVRLFGPLRAYADGSEVEIEVPAGARVRDAREALVAVLEAGRPGQNARALVSRSVLGSETDVLDNDSPLPAGTQALAALPPVCGG
jgi:molybdopterin converting factor small subunit